MYAISKQSLTRSALILALSPIASPVSAVVFDFNSGNNQGWNVEFASISGGGPATSQGAAAGATWQDSSNYNGNPTQGRPPAFGPLDPLDGSIGSISGLYGGDTSGFDTIINSFTSPVFTGESMSSISAAFVSAGVEAGIQAAGAISAQVWYKKAGSSSFFFGSLADLTTTSPDPFSNIPEWTLASVGVTPGDLVTQIGVNVWVDLGGVTNWPQYIDQVSSEAGNPGGGGGTLPEPGTLALMGLGLLGFGFRYGKRQPS